MGSTPGSRLQLATSQPAPSLSGARQRGNLEGPIEACRVDPREKSWTNLGTSMNGAAFDPGPTCTTKHYLLSDESPVVIFSFV